MTRDARWHDEIALREASLADARREHEAGELSDEEFAAIEERETRALTRARAALEAFAPAPPVAPRPRAGRPAPTGAPAASRHATQWHDEIALREASLADARREHDAGQLSDEELAQIEEREGRALARARAALEAFALTTPAAPTGPRRRRRSLLLVAVLCFAFVLIALMVAALTVRQPGTSGTGAISLDRSQRIAQYLSEAQTDTASRDYAAALAAYQQVLNLDGSNVTALTETGWLDFSAGSAAHDASLTAMGVADMRRAVTLEPSSPAARLNYAMAAALTPGNRALAVREFRVFLTLHPSPAERAVAAPFLRRLHLAG